MKCDFNLDVNTWMLFLSDLGGAIDATPSTAKRMTDFGKDGN